MKRIFKQQNSGLCLWSHLKMELELLLLLTLCAAAAEHQFSMVIQHDVWNQRDVLFFLRMNSLKPR